MGEVATQSVEMTRIASPGRVNAKQHERIIKRRLARQKLEATIARTKKSHTLAPTYTGPNNSQDFKQCLRRPRGPDGRFLTPDQLAAQKLEKLSIRAVQVEHGQNIPRETHAIFCQKSEISKSEQSRVVMKLSAPHQPSTGEVPALVTM